MELAPQGRDRAEGARTGSYETESRFLGPPCNPGRSDSPIPVFALAFPREAFPRRGRLKHSLAYTPTRFGLPLDSSLTRGSSDWTPLATRGPPSAQSSFAWHKRYSCQGGVQHHLEGHYPFFIAPTSSCAKPAPSPGLRVSTLISGGPCRLLRTPAGNRFFPTLSLQVCPRMLEP